MDILTDTLSAVQPYKDSTLVDRLSYYYSVTLLVICSTFLFGWSFVGTPISCWFPAYYNGWWIEYALDYCFVQNTYYLPILDSPATNYWDLSQNYVHIPKNVTEREDRQLGYYQWVPFVLALEALFFYLPVVLWRNLYDRSGIKVKVICDTLANADNIAPDTRRGNIQKVARFLDHSLQISSKYHGARSFMAGRYISILYLFVKLLFALNVVAQFFVLQAFLGLEHTGWGLTLFSDLASGREWQETGHFPRVTMCDFEVRVLGNLHRHTVQCVLMINMFNEKIFVFLYCWFLFVAVVSVLSLLYWVVTTISDQTGQRIINNYLDRIDRDVAHSPRRKIWVKSFLSTVLKADGIFLLRLAISNSGEVVVSELIEQMWTNYKRRCEQEASDDGIERKLGSQYHRNGVGSTPDPPSVRRATAPPKGNDYPTLPMRGDYQFPPAYDQPHQESDL